MNRKKFYFITIEGIEGAGKSTAIHYIQKLLNEKQIDHIITREPGGTLVAESIRQVLLHTHGEPVHPFTECLLMFAGRLQHLTQVIKPTLEKGQWVVCDRFTDATYAYQGGGRGVAYEQIKTIESWVQDSLQPDLTLLMDLPVELGLSRIMQRQKDKIKDRIESESLDFFKKVRDTYLQRAKADPQRFKVIDASQNLAHVQNQISTIVQSLFTNAK